jgi:dTDP-4-amino-4,6-dideoxygalactose transaminase
MRHAKGIQTSIHYPPVHTFELYRNILRQDAAELTLTNSAGEREVTLPLYPSLTEEDVRHIVESTRELIADKSLKKG